MEVSRKWDGGLYTCSECRLADGHSDDCPVGRAKREWEEAVKDLEERLEKHDAETARQQAVVDAMTDDGSPEYVREHDRLVKLISQGAALSERLANAGDPKELERMTNAATKKTQTAAAAKQKRAAAKESAGEAKPKQPRGVTITDAEVEKILTASKDKESGAVDTDKAIGKFRANGLGFQRIADTLIAKGVPTKRGGKWTSTTVKNVVDRLAKGESK